MPPACRGLIVRAISIAPNTAAPALDPPGSISLSATAPSRARPGSSRNPPPPTSAAGARRTSRGRGRPLRGEAEAERARRLRPDALDDVRPLGRPTWLLFDFGGRAGRTSSRRARLYAADLTHDAAMNDLVLPSSRPTTSTRARRRSPRRPPGEPRSRPGRTSPPPRTGTAPASRRSPTSSRRRPSSRRQARAGDHAGPDRRRSAARSPPRSASRGRPGRRRRRCPAGEPRDACRAAVDELIARSASGPPRPRRRALSRERGAEQDPLRPVRGPADPLDAATAAADYFDLSADAGRRLATTRRSVSSSACRSSPASDASTTRRRPKEDAPRPRAPTRSRAAGRSSRSGPSYFGVKTAAQRVATARPPRQRAAVRRRRARPVQGRRRQHPRPPDGAERARARPAPQDVQARAVGSSRGAARPRRPGPLGPRAADPRRSPTRRSPMKRPAPPSPVRRSRGDLRLRARRARSRRRRPRSGDRQPPSRSGTSRSSSRNVGTSSRTRPSPCGRASEARSRRSHFREGQDVKGRPPLRDRPAPYRGRAAQAEANLARDRAHACESRGET